jgi:hypothetical protein
MSQEIVLGTITDFHEDGTVVIEATVPSLEKALLRKYKTVQIGFNDGRHISPIQRRKIYALISDVAEYIEGYRTSETIESTKQALKMDFVLTHLQGMERKMFSLSDVSMSTAAEFIDYVVDFIIRNDIPTRIPLIENCSDISKYIYACLVNKRCCICGEPADLHHVDAIGMGNDRDNVVHIGRDALPLCREHHISLHSMGNKEFMKQYHLETIKIDKKIAKIYKLNTKEK